MNAILVRIIGPKGFLDLLQKFPLRKEYMGSFLEEKVERIRIVENNRGSASIDYTSNGKFVINIKKACPDKQVALLHEFIHGVYQVFPFKYPADTPNSEIELIEWIIEDEAQRFYDKNQEYCDQLLEKTIQEAIS